MQGVSIDSAGIFPTAEGIYDIGYCLHKSKWKQGFGSEIVELLLEWLRNNGAKKVIAEVAIDNIPSNLLLQKFGFTVEKKSSFKNTTWMCASTAIFIRKSFEVIIKQ